MLYTLFKREITDCILTQEITMVGDFNAYIDLIINKMWDNNLIIIPPKISSRF